MKHLGDITKINGHEIEPVDVITGGSPCQDLSIAGARKGLAGERSGLFMEQIRVIKEMREGDKKRGRTGEFIRPRFAVWENVPGATSSNSGRDYQAVLTEFIRVIEPDAPDVPMPPKGKWPKSGYIYDELGRWSLAYRIHDAQFWGVPQRRRRIAVVADYGGLSAGQVVFGPYHRRETGGTESDETVTDSGEGIDPVSPQSDCLPGDPEQSGTPREGTPAGTEGGTDSASGNGTAISFQERAGKPGGGKGILIQGEHVGALSTLNNQAVLTCGNPCEEGARSEPIPIGDKATRYQGGGFSRHNDGAANAFLIGHPGDPAHTLSTADRHEVFASTTVGFSGGQGARAGGIGYQEECAPSLKSAESGTNTVPTVMCLNPWEVQSKRINPVEGVADALWSGEKRWAGGESYVLDTVSDGAEKNAGKKYQEASYGFKPRQGAGARTLGYEQEKAPTINTDENYAGLRTQAVHQNASGEVRQSETAYTIGTNSNASGRNTPIVIEDESVKQVAAVDCRNMTEDPEINGTLQAKPNGGISYNTNIVVRETTKCDDLG